jgi:hypothetical protein
MVKAIREYIPVVRKIAECINQIFRRAWIAISIVP